MSMDYDRRQGESSVTDAEGVMFASTPIWERSRKRRGASGRKVTRSEPAASAPAEPRSFAAETAAPAAAATYEEPMPLDRPIERPLSATTSTASTTDDAGLVAPIGRPSARTAQSRAARDSRPNGAMTAAIAAGVVAVGAIGAGAWYLTSDRDGVPELAPGAVTTEVAAAPILPPAEAMTTPVANEPPLAETAPAPAEPPRVMAARSEPRAPARARPAAPSAESGAVNASATTVLPEGPQPYASLNPGAAPAAVNPPVLTVPPTTSAAPAPAEAPAEFPATPPITAEPSPAADPTSPETTPPTSS